MGRLITETLSEPDITELKLLMWWSENELNMLILKSPHKMEGLLPKTPKISTAKISFKESMGDEGERYIAHRLKF